MRIPYLIILILLFSPEVLADNIVLYPDYMVSNGSNKYGFRLCLYYSSDICNRGDYTYSLQAQSEIGIII